MFTKSKSTRFVRIPVNFTKNIGAIYGSKLNKVHVSFVVYQVEVCSKQYSKSRKFLQKSLVILLKSLW